MKFALFGKKVDDRIRFWFVSNNKIETKDGRTEDIAASMNVSLSRDAEAYFKEHCAETKNKDIRKCFVEVADGDFWFKPVKGKDGNFVIVFINRMSEAKKEEKSAW